MPIDVTGAQLGLDRLLAALPVATARASSEMADAVKIEAQANLKNPLGPLATSMRAEGPDMIGTTSWRTKMGPTLIYGRQRELGGHIDPVDATILTAHYRAPGYWTWEGQDVFTNHVFQLGQHYLKRGVEMALPRLHHIAARIWGDALRSAF